MAVGALLVGGAYYAGTLRTTTLVRLSPPPVGSASGTKASPALSPSGQPERRKELKEKEMKELRTRAWELFSEVKALGLPFPQEWRLEDEAFTSANEFKRPKNAWRAFQAAELIPGGVNGATSPPSNSADPSRIYESTFFNPVAYAHIQDEKYPLYSNKTIKALRDISKRREINDFPPGSQVVKTFWRVVPKDSEIRVGVWRWPTTDTAEDVAGAIPEKQWAGPDVCVEERPEPTSKCLQADKWFPVARVKNPKAFTCPFPSCPDLQENQLLILLAVHVAAKESPDWLWATYWWKGGEGNRTSGNSWTCDNAQRPPMAPNDPWSNYSMNVTRSSFLRRRDVDDKEKKTCGVPAKIGIQDEEYLATYNPFIESVGPNGRKSNCVVCHARASTNELAQGNSVPPVNEWKGPSVTEFEEHLRTDYLWTVRKHLGTTPSRE
jgi:hypothetical protein